MLKRKSFEILESWINSNYGLLIDGARQIGKTFIIEEFLKTQNIDYVEINLLTNFEAVNILSKALNGSDFILRLSSLINKPLNKGKTVIFIDEIQEFKNFDIITLSKELIKNSGYKFVFSGSLLGVEQYGITSWPEGYMILHRMYPLDFEEFLWACGVNDELIEIVKDCIKKENEIPDYIHAKFLDLYKKYLIVGGMPNAVNKFIATNDLNEVSLAQKTIESFLSKDVSKYSSENDKILIKTMYDLLPSELNSQNKRFSLKDIPTKLRNENLGLSFGWFIKAGIAIGVFNVDELKSPLALATKHRLVKLFQSDVGILTYRLMDNSIRNKILNDQTDLNIGSIYENAVAQALYAKGFENLYYFSKKNFGEIDFVIEYKGEIIPIEVKSGKNYYIHSTLNKLKNNNEISKYILLSNNNIKRNINVLELPIYSLCFFE